MDIDKDILMSDRRGSGYNTRSFGEWLTDYFKKAASYAGYKVFYDHGNANLNANVVATKGFIGESVSNANRLTDLDVMVVGPDNKVRLLIEIEERGASPKKFLGDVLATLLCNQFAVRLNSTQTYFGITGDTELVVAGIVPTNGQRLNKINEVILPRLAQMSGMSDGPSPAKVSLLFSGDILTTVNELKALICHRFPEQELELDNKRLPSELDSP